MQVPAQNDRGESAAAWLAEQGISPRVATIRSSASRSLRECPFEFYLSNRLGILPCDRVLPKDAFLLGTFAHAHLEAHLRGFDLTATDQLVGVIEAAETLEAGERNAQSRYALSKDEIQESISSSRDLAKCFVQGALAKVPLPLGEGTPYELIMVEPFITFAPDTFPLSPSALSKCPVAIKPDAVLYREDRNELWLLDFKTTAFPPSLRMASCKWDFQVHLYAEGMKQVVRGGHMEHMGVPREAKVAGFIHYVIEKPTIRISKKTIKNSGYETALSEYVARCREWYKAEGEFSHLKFERTPEKEPVNISYVRLDALPPADYYHLLSGLSNACSRTAYPDAFPRTAEGISDIYGRSLSPYAPFYDLPVRAWPELINERFQISHRDANAKPVIEIEQYHPPE